MISIKRIPTFINSYLIVAFSAFLSTYKASSKSVKYEHISVDYYRQYVDISVGLSNNYVSKIAKDEFGMMWFAAEGGLNRYDGSHFKVFRPEKRYQRLRNENIETIFIDR